MLKLLFQLKNFNNITICFTRFHQESNYNMIYLEDYHVIVNALSYVLLTNLYSLTKAEAGR